MRSTLIHLFIFGLLISCSAPFIFSDETLPEGSAPPAIEVDHFPSRMHTFVWRNWPIVHVERLAKVLDTSSENVREIAESMGLTPQHPIPEKDKNRIYITLIRRNWHLLPYNQLLTLLDMTAEDLAYSLREDDFLFIKLGRLKPKCEPLRYTPPTEDMKKRCAEIKQIVRESLGDELDKPAEPRFHFIKELSQPTEYEKPSQETSRFSPRYIYSYFAIYGDPLMNPELDPYPDGLLQRLSELGVDGVWMHVVWRQLAPSKIFPEFGQNHGIRLKNLRNLVERAKKYGIGIYLYVNEPRAMPESFFEGREDMKGVREGDHFALCTSNPKVRQWLENTVAHVFENVPGLAGAFTITASENLTNCASHRRHKDCPRCKNRTASEIIAEVNATVEKGVHRGNPDAKVIAWDWGWSDDWAENIIHNLPKSVWLMSVSEWSKTITRGGIETKIGEYSISAVGPGPRATKHWAIAKEEGLKTAAKMQINNTWELSAVPYLPVLDLIAEHCENLIECDVDGMMMSWTLGGFPSPNLEVVKQFDQIPPPDKSSALDKTAQNYFGEDGAHFARDAWTTFSKGFQEFPVHPGVLYRCPSQFGPSNLLYPKPTGYHSTMIGFPYDNLRGWRGPYPPEIFADQFYKVATSWKAGLRQLEKAVQKTPAEKRTKAESQLRFARAAQLHFATVANQTRFILNRDKLLDQETTLSSAEEMKLIQDIERILQDEVEIAEDLFALTRQDSRIGYEASNHYYYLPVDLMEKVINCRFIDEHIQELYQ